MTTDTKEVDHSVVVYGLRNLARISLSPNRCLWGGIELSQQFTNAADAIESLTAQVAELQGKLAEAREVLKRVEFKQNGYCPDCGGWMASPNGCTPGKHTKGCPLANAIKETQP